jgi:hypothetical protein
MRRALAVATLALAIPLAAATLPSGFSETTITSALSAPTAMAMAPDGRIFVCQVSWRTVGPFT